MWLHLLRTSIREQLQTAIKISWDCFLRQKKPYSFSLSSQIACFRTLIIFLALLLMCSSKQISFFKGGGQNLAHKKTGERITSLNLLAIPGLKQPRMLTTFCTAEVFSCSSSYAQALREPFLSSCFLDPTRLHWWHRVFAVPGQEFYCFHWTSWSSCQVHCYSLLTSQWLVFNHHFFLQQHGGCSEDDRLYNLPKEWVETYEHILIHILLLDLPEAGLETCIFSLLELTTISMTIQR